MTKTTTKSSKTRVKTQKTTVNDLDINSEFDSLEINVKGKKVNRKKKQVLMDYDKNSEEYGKILNDLIKGAVKEAKRDKNHIDFSTGAILTAIKMEVNTLFTAKHFAKSMNISTTAVYNKMETLINANQVKVIQLPNRRKYYTSVKNTQFN